jgi:hypothetical protein
MLRRRLRRLCGIPCSLIVAVMCLLQCASESGESVLSSDSDGSTYIRQQQAHTPSMTTAIRLNAAALRAGRRETEDLRHHFFMETSSDVAESLKAGQTHDHGDVQAPSADTAKSKKNGLFHQSALQSKASSHGSQPRYQHLDTEEQGETIRGMQNGKHADSQSDISLRDIFTDGVVTLSDNAPGGRPVAGL